MSRKNKTEHFSGYFSFDKVVGKFYDDCYDEFNDSIYIEKVMYNNPATIVFWSDGTKTISKCHGEDKYDPKVGLLLAILKKFGGSGVSKLMDDWGPTTIDGMLIPREVVTVSNVRKRNRV